MNDFEILDFGWRKTKDDKSNKGYVWRFRKKLANFVFSCPIFLRKVNVIFQTNLAVVIYGTTYCCSLYWKWDEIHCICIVSVEIQDIQWWSLPSDNFLLWIVNQLIWYHLLHSFLDTKRNFPSPRHEGVQGKVRGQLDAPAAWSLGKNCGTI